MGEKDAISAAETPFEVYAYLRGFRSQSNFVEYQKFLQKFLNTYPSFPGLPDDSDVQPQGVACQIPDHFNKTFVHFLPGGYLNGHTVRISYLGKSKFNQANAEDMGWLESDSFDFINYAYVLHEMPAPNALSIVNEMYRLLKKGGTMNGFEVPFVENVAERWAYVEFNTWNHHWEEAGPQGPEPYMEEYEFGVMLTDALASAGFSKVEYIDYSY